jgi:hypothetical protein
MDKPGSGTSGSYGPADTLGVGPAGSWPADGVWARVQRRTDGRQARSGPGRGAGRARRRDRAPGGGRSRPGLVQGHRAVLHQHVCGRRHLPGYHSRRGLGGRARVPLIRRAHGLRSLDRGPALPGRRTGARVTESKHYAVEINAPDHHLNGSGMPLRREEVDSPSRAFRESPREANLGSAGAQVDQRKSQQPALSRLQDDRPSTCLARVASRLGRLSPGRIHASLIGEHCGFTLRTSCQPAQRQQIRGPAATWLLCHLCAEQRPSHHGLRDSRYGLGINLTPARALGLTIPPALLQRADQTVE